MAFNKKGFTVIELMIAMSIFSVAIVLVMAGVIYVGRQYQQTSNRVALEDVSRDIHRQITSSVQFTKKDPVINSSGSWEALCVGSDMYVYGSKYIANSGDFNLQNDGLFIKPNNSNCNTADINAGASDTNLLVEGAKVAHFSWDPATDTLTTVFVKSPGVDLLKLNGNSEETKCDGTKPGREYCSFVKMQSTAVGRI